ncbi:MAG: hypothetical protein IJ153_05400 [Clostridia bacterium]|nr:hypothetical protein [Clostridia bacterium]
MLIIKEPSKLLLAEKYVSEKTPIRFNCKICRCEFVAAKGERELFVPRIGPGPMYSYRVVCPGCGETIEADGVLVTPHEFLAIIEAKEKASEEAKKKESAPRYDDEED